MALVADARHRGDHEVMVIDHKELIHHLRKRLTVVAGDANLLGRHLRRDDTDLPRAARHAVLLHAEGIRLYTLAQHTERRADDAAPHCPDHVTPARRTDDSNDDGTTRSAHP
jgi:hypothetical protein